MRVESGTPVRRRGGIAGALVAAAVIAMIAALLASEDAGFDPVRSEYAPLGQTLGRVAQTAELPKERVPRAVHGREFATAIGLIAGSERLSLDVNVERITGRKGRQTTLVSVAQQDWPGSDFIRVPWSVSRLVPNVDFVLSPDFSRIRLDTTICDERSGQTKPLVVEWTMKQRPLDLTSYGQLADRGGDATFTGRFGDTTFSPRGGLGSVYVQVWPKKAGKPDPHLRMDGKRRKPVRCPR